MNQAIEAFRKAGNAYYRYFNDGDPIPGVARKPDFHKRYSHEEKQAQDEKKVEEFMDKKIITLWKASKGAKVEPKWHIPLKLIPKDHETGEW